MRCCLKFNEGDGCMGALDTLKDINKRNWKHVLGQFIKFGLIGASNTLISTAIYYEIGRAHV